MSNIMLWSGSLALGAPAASAACARSLAFITLLSVRNEGPVPRSYKVPRSGQLPSAVRIIGESDAYAPFIILILLYRLPQIRRWPVPGCSLAAAS